MGPTHKVMFIYPAAPRAFYFRRDFKYIKKKTN